MACLAFGQAVVSSDILGQITDPSGAAIPGATVTVTNQSTGFTRTVHSDTSGAYLCNGMVSGLYTVSVEKSGFKKYVRTEPRFDGFEEIADRRHSPVGSDNSDRHREGRDTFD